MAARAEMSASICAAPRAAFGTGKRATFGISAKQTTSEFKSGCSIGVNTTDCGCGSLLDLAPSSRLMLMGRPEEGRSTEPHPTRKRTASIKLMFFTAEAFWGVSGSPQPHCHRNFPDFSSKHIRMPLSMGSSSPSTVYATRLLRGRSLLVPTKTFPPLMMGPP